MQIGSKRLILAMYWTFGACFMFYFQIYRKIKIRGKEKMNYVFSNGFIVIGMYYTALQRSLIQKRCI